MARECVIRIYLHEFTNKDDCAAFNFEFLVTSERVDVNPENKRTKNALNILIFNLVALRENISCQAGSCEKG